MANPILNFHFDYRHPSLIEIAVRIDFQTRLSGEKLVSLGVGLMPTMWHVPWGKQSILLGLGLLGLGPYWLVFLFITIGTKNSSKISNYFTIWFNNNPHDETLGEYRAVHHFSISPLWPEEYVGKLDNIHSKSASSAPSSPSWPLSPSSLWRC